MRLSAREGTFPPVRPRAILASATLMDQRETGPSETAELAPPRVLTFLIADVRGYTRFTEEHGDEAAARLAGEFARIARAAVETRGGSVVELRGDEVLAAFESSRQAMRSA